MIEVFKTNITSVKMARRLTREIHDHFVGYKVNFDLTDCDRIMRVVCKAEDFCRQHFIQWLSARDCVAEILPD